MDILDFDRLRSVDVASDPFPHILLPKFVKPEALASVVAALPAMRGRGSFPIGALQLGAAARGLIDGLEGEQFQNIVADKFGLELNDADVHFNLQFATRAWGTLQALRNQR